MANLNLANLAVEAEKFSLTPLSPPSSPLSHQRCVLLADLALKAERRSMSNHSEYLLMGNLAGVAERYQELAQTLSWLVEEQEDNPDFALERFLAAARRIGVEQKPATDDKMRSYNAEQDEALAELPPRAGVGFRMQDEALAELPPRAGVGFRMQGFVETLLSQGTNNDHPLP